jgi:4-amino-4-deoxy-L-arabinose transferase-like glycosyltransferase
MFLAGWELRWLLPQGQFPVLTVDIPIPYPAIGWMITATLLLIASIVLLRPSAVTFTLYRGALKTYPMRPIWIVVGVIALAVLGEANTRLFFKDFWLSFHLQMLCFVIGMVGLARGLGGLPIQPILAVKWRDILTHQTTLILTLIIVVGFGIRVWRLGDLIHFSVDENDYFGAYTDFLLYPTQSLIHPMDDGYGRATRFHAYLTWWTVGIWGRDFFGIRMISAITGTLTILATYFLGRTLSDRRLGLISAGVIALLPIHVHFSRNAMFNIVDPLFGTLALTFLCYGMRYRAGWAYIWAGATLSVVTYLYEAGRLLYLAFAPAWIIFMCVWSRPTRHWSGFFKMGIILLLLAAPFFYTQLQGSQLGFADRLGEQGANFALLRSNIATKSLVEGVTIYLRDVLQFVFWRFIYTPDPSNLYFPVGTGLLHWYVGPLLLIGVVIALVRLRLTRFFLLGWMLAGCLGLSFLATFEWSQRFCVLFIPMAILIGIGIRYPLEWFGLPERAARWGMVGIVILFGVVSLGDYYAQLPEYNSRVRRYFFQYDYIDALYQTVPVTQGTLTEPEYLFIISNDQVNLGFMGTLRDFLGLKVLGQTMRPAEVNQAVLSLLPTDRALFFAVPPNEKRVMGLLKQQGAIQLPDTQYETVPVELRFTVWWLPKPEVQRLD